MPPPKKLGGFCPKRCQLARQVAGCISQWQKRASVDLAQKWAQKRVVSRVLWGQSLTKKTMISELKSFLSIYYPAYHLGYLSSPKKKTSVLFTSSDSPSVPLCMLQFHAWFQLKPLLHQMSGHLKNPGGISKIRYLRRPHASIPKTWQHPKSCSEAI